MNILSSLPAVERGMRALIVDPTALTALYESLCCEDYHKSRENLSFPLGDVMKLVQGARTLRLGDLVPAMTRFLFDKDQDRHKFAVVGWQKAPRKLNRKSFDWVVHDSLVEAIQSVSAPSSSVEDVERFWAGLLLILDKLDQELITHSLRGLEVQPDIFHLALQHLTYDSEAILDSIIQAFINLLEKAPKTFWQAFGAISPAAVAEQIFSSPAFERLLARSNLDESIDDIHIPDAMSWIPSFVQSLPAAQQHDACRSILFNVLERFQKTAMQTTSKLARQRAGLSALQTTISTFTAKDYTINTSTSFITINNILGLVDKYKDMIVECATLRPNCQGFTELAELGLQVIRSSLTLDCKSLCAEYEALRNFRPVDHGLDSHIESIWRAVVDAFRTDDMNLAKNILQGITPLIGLEEFRVKNSSEKLPKDKKRFNDDFGQLTEIVACVFERISDFKPENLRRLCSLQSTAIPLFAGLTSAHDATYDAAVEVVKSVTGEVNRKDAIAHLLKDFMETALNAFALAVHKINEFATFAAVPKVLKTGRDVLEGLCDSQSGILRSKPSLSIGERSAIKAWWMEQWQATLTAFNTVEEWSKYYDNNLLTNFCRDVMDHADALFDQYNVLASALHSPLQGTGATEMRSDHINASRKDVLGPPLQAMQKLRLWLRLKDNYLVSTVVGLLSKILRRLGEHDMEIDQETHLYISRAISGDLKTVLKEQQRAELRRALDEHLGVEFIEQPRLATLPKRQGTIDAWSKSANGARHEPISGGRSDNRQGTIDLEQWQSRSSISGHSINDDIRLLSKSLEQGKSTLDQIRARQAVKPLANLKSTLRSGETLKQSRDREKEEKKKRDAAFIAQAQALRAPTSTVAGEGSGLKGLGVLGKDHAPPKQEIMVSSDEESDDDDGVGARALIQKTKRSGKVADYQEEKRRLLREQQQGPLKKTKIIRSAKDMRARLIPDMSALHLNILKWDIFHDKDEPPGGIDCIKVPNTFQTATDYRNTFHPLLLSEAWRSFRTAKEETTSRPFDIAVVTRMSVDQFYEVSTTISIADNRESNIMEGDIVLLSKGQDPMKDRSAPHCLGRVWRINRKREIIEVSYRLNGTTVSSSGLLPSLAPNSKIRGFKITSMTTIEREYGALSSLQYYDLCEEILEAQPSPLLDYGDTTLKPLRALYGVNTAQAKAIWSAKENDAFTLIQGPPGSGKTKTIVAMVGAILTDSFKDTGVIVNRPQNNRDANKEAMPKKLLVCAPSNAAVDELVMRLKAGIKTVRGEERKINVIRLGRSDAINANVQDVTLDELVRLRLEGDNKNGKGVVSEREKLHLHAGQLKQQIALLREQQDEARIKGDSILENRLQREIDAKKRDQGQIGRKIDEDKDSGNTAARDNEINRRRVQQDIISSAHVLCATLSGSGHEMFKNLNVEFETVIIDEAAQCIELSALIPLKYGCSKCILVGDPKQLPPTVLSRSAAAFGYEQSLFVRMQQNHPDRIHLLDTQYRMHPDISSFPSEQFYDGKLVDGTGMAELRKRPWHDSSLLGTYRFFDVKGIQSTAAVGHSFINRQEIDAALLLYERLKKDYPSYDIQGQVGIITPYKAQLREMKMQFQRRYGEDILKDIDFNTTDAFQGREAEIIIFSCVRAKASGGIGFLDDIRRMNVGLTRAKSSLWVLGNSISLKQGKFWNMLLKDAQKRNLYTEGDVLAMLRQPSTNFSRPLSSTKPLGSRSSESRYLPAPPANDMLCVANTSTGRRPSPPDITMVDAPDFVEDHPQSSKSNNSVKTQSSKIMQKTVPRIPQTVQPISKGEDSEKVRPVVKATAYTPANAEDFLKQPIKSLKRGSSPSNDICPVKKRV
jgi:senataxin